MLEQEAQRQGRMAKNLSIPACIAQILALVDVSHRPVGSASRLRSARSWRQNQVNLLTLIDFSLPSSFTLELQGDEFPGYVQQEIQRAAPRFGIKPGNVVGIRQR
jgi:hypothetical protein